MCEITRGGTVSWVQCDCVGLRSGTKRISPSPMASEDHNSIPCQCSSLVLNWCTTLTRVTLPQTGSGKTYTMGTGYTVGGSTHGVIPQVMEFIFRQIESLKKKADFQIRVSFIEVCVLRGLQRSVMPVLIFLLGFVV